MSDATIEASKQLRHALSVHHLRTDDVDVLDTEIARLRALIDRAAKPWLALPHSGTCRTNWEPGIAWEGAIDSAMEAAVAEIEQLRAEVERYKWGLRVHRTEIAQLRELIDRRDKWAARGGHR